MTGPRIPLVAGVEPGAGTSTLAAALHAEDAGLLAQQADVVVCRPAPASLRAAAAIACPGRGPHPVLVVTGPVAGEVPAAVRTRFGTVVELPLVEGWAGAATPAAAAAGVLAAAVGALPAAQRPYAEALREVVAALIRSGQLDAAAPPMAIRPRAADPWRGTRPPAAPPSRHRLRTDPPVEPAKPRRRLPDSAPCAPRPAEPAGRAPGPHTELVHPAIPAVPAVPAVPDEDDEAIELRNQLAGGRAG
jgi:hypothetical protein